MSKFMLQPGDYLTFKNQLVNDVIAVRVNYEEVTPYGCQKIVLEILTIKPLLPRDLLTVSSGQPRD